MQLEPGKVSLNLGVAQYQGYGATAATVAYTGASGRYNVNAGVSSAGGKSVARAGMGFTF